MAAELTATAQLERFSGLFDWCVEQVAAALAQLPNVAEEIRPAMRAAEAGGLVSAEKGGNDAASSRGYAVRGCRARARVSFV